MQRASEQNTKANWIDEKKKTNCDDVFSSHVAPQLDANMFRKEAFDKEWPFV